MSDPLQAIADFRRNLVRVSDLGILKLTQDLGEVFSTVDVNKSEFLFVKVPTYVRCSFNLAEPETRLESPYAQLNSVEFNEIAKELVSEFKLGSVTEDSTSEEVILKHSISVLLGDLTSIICFNGSYRLIGRQVEVLREMFKEEQQRIANVLVPSLIAEIVRRLNGNPRYEVFTEGTKLVAQVRAEFHEND